MYHNYWTPQYNTVRGKILEGENFGESLLMKINGEENFGESAGRSSVISLYFITIGVENFGELYTIRQKFPPPNFSHVR